MNDRKVRDLLRLSPDGLPNALPEESCLESHYAGLKANSDTLLAELLRFVFSRRGVWSKHFFEDLLF
jgi:hypothetical protein